MSLLFQWVKQVLPPPPAKWSPDDIPDLSGKVALVTGGNAGIGREIVKALLRKNAKVYLAARSPEKAQKVIDELAGDEKTGRRAEFLRLDLSDLAAVREAALDFQRRETHIDMLFLNAGVMCPSPDALTAQGTDLTFGTNVTGHFLLLRLLFPLLLSSPSPAPSPSPSPNPASPPDTPSPSDPTTTRAPARIIWLSSAANYLAPGPRGTISYTTLSSDRARRKAGMMAMYAQSKLAPIALSSYLARKYPHTHNRGEGDGEGEGQVVSIAVDPGQTRSEIYHRGKAWFWQLWESLLTYPTPYGALTPLYAGTAPEAASMSGKYLRPWARLGSPNPSALDEGEQKKLWDWLEKQVESYL